MIHGLVHDPKNFIRSLFNFIFAFDTVMYQRIHTVKTSVPRVKSSLGGFETSFDFDENLSDNNWRS
jgi:hypothetical protein